MRDDMGWFDPSVREGDEVVDIEVFFLARFGVNGLLACGGLVI